MRSLGLRLAGAVLTGALVVGATSCSGQGHPAASTLDAPIPTGLTATLHGGTMYLLVGGLGSANVWSVSAGHPHGDQLTKNPHGFGISWIDASAAGLIMADARSSVDVTSVYQGHHDKALPAGHSGAGVINADGTIAYVGIPGSISGHGPNTWRVELTSVHGGPAHVIYQQKAPSLGGLAWGPNHQLAAASGGSHGPSQILILTSTGHVITRLRPSIGGAVTWNSHAPGIAIGNVPGLTLNGTGITNDLITPSGRQSALPHGWLPMCWSPDGSALIVAHGLSVGLWRSRAPGAVTTLGTTGKFGPLNQCVWLSKPAAGA